MLNLIIGTCHPHIVSKRATEHQLKGSVLNIFHDKVCNRHQNWRPHGSAKSLLIYTPMKEKIGGTETKFQKIDKLIHTEVSLWLERRISLESTAGDINSQIDTHVSEQRNHIKGDQNMIWLKDLRTNEGHKLMRGHENPSGNKIFAICLGGW